MSVENLVNRRLMLKTLRQELVGPSPQGDELDCSTSIRFENRQDSYGPYRQKSNGDEILQRDPPTKRYGIGILYPMQTFAEDTVEDAGHTAIGMHGRSDLHPVEDASNNVLTEGAENDIKDALERTTSYNEEFNDLDLLASNTYRPSSMGISFLAELSSDTKIVIDTYRDGSDESLGRYKKIEVLIKDNARPLNWWIRIPIRFEEEIKALDILTQRKIDVKLDNTDELGSIDLHIEIYSRPNPYSDNPAQRLLTICLVNRTDTVGSHSDELCVFQAGFQVRVLSSSRGNQILPYPEARVAHLDNEEKSLALLYRKFQTYATGHGCSANWGEKDHKGHVGEVIAESLPMFETPSTTPDIVDENDIPIKVSMASLGGILPDVDGFDEINRVVEAYEDWIADQQHEASRLPEELRQTAERHLRACASSAIRMREGIAFLRKNATALRAFQLANQAILLQQLTERNVRSATYNTKSNRWEFSREYHEPDFAHVPEGRGTWRAFQIAFLLMTLKSSIDPTDIDRETVELIWFPTGGGKTEAYLGLTAFSLFMRRLENPDDYGVHVITRYTLRLLTAQQFQRATKLVCAMEKIRQNNEDLGRQPFSIGIWVGSSNTPNTRSDAVNILNALRKGDRFTENKFILGQCPWCGAEMGPITNRIGRRWQTHIAGYRRRGNTVQYHCSDSNCYFHQELPIYSIDEDIYDIRPSIVIGTVDKFATLTWKPEARTLFGINSSGEREHAPPGLIIQDELHLISGPLGSMVGLFEAVIEELCTDRRNEQTIRPKIVSSTATIRRYEEQVKALYGRENVALFPPSGLDAEDSFFARYARDSTGKLKPGRIYVGVHGPGLGSLQTVQVRTFSALMQSPVNISKPEQQDPWWTLLIFFNSLRELGTTLSLFQSDIPDYLKVVAQRSGIPYGNMRKLKKVRELTGRLKSDEVPKAIADLEVSCNLGKKNYPVDACLASNILEVGVDIDRLSLMSVVGQPKSTSQYIQVTGRVGRKWEEKPGLVVTIYTASKPRDRSHFEKFRTYHERLYAQVEPVSVTPFSPPALDRALHAVMVMYARQIGSNKVANSPFPYPDRLIESLKNILIPRVSAIDEIELENFVRVFERRASEWQRWQRTAWEKRTSPESFLLLRAGDYVEADNKLLTWSTPTSMRSVDAECEAQITSLYLHDEMD